MTKRAGPRYAILPADAVTDPNLSGPDLRVLALLGRHIDRKGWCTRAQGKMATELSIARGTLQRSLGRLVEAGYVEVEHVTRRDGGQAANRYRVVLDDEARADQLDFFGQLAGADDDEGDARLADMAPPASRMRHPLPHLERAPPASPERGTQEERPLHRTSPSETIAAPLPRVAANDQPTVDQQPDAVPVATAAGAVPLPVDYRTLSERLRTAVGDAINTASPTFLVIAEPIGWLAAGCDLEADVLPTLAGLAARARGSPIRSWSYFTPAVIQARDRRIAAAQRPAGSPPSADIVPFDLKGPDHARLDPQPDRASRFGAIAARRRAEIAGRGPGGEDG